MQGVGASVPIRWHAPISPPTFVPECAGFRGSKTAVEELVDSLFPIHHRKKR